MAIVIPSKNIYEIDDQKVVDNEVDKIEISAKDVRPKNEFNVNVYSGDFITETGYTFDRADMASNYYENQDTLLGAKSFAAVQAYIKPYYFSGRVSVPREHFDNIVSEIYGGKDQSGATNIKYTTVCEKKEANNVTATYDRAIFGDIQIEYPQEAGEVKNYELPKERKSEWYNSFAGAHASVTTTLRDLTNLDSVKIQETEEYFIFDFKVLCGEELVSLNAEGADEVLVDAYGTATLYKPRSITINVYGNTIGIDLQDETVKVGDGQHVYSLDGSELTQKSNEQQIPYGITIGSVAITDEFHTWYNYSHDANSDDLKEGDVLILNGERAVYERYYGFDLTTPKYALCVENGGQFAALAGLELTTIVTLVRKEALQKSCNEIIEEWKNGKEIATLKCAIADYDEEGNYNVEIRVTAVERPSPLDPPTLYDTFRFTATRWGKNILISRNATTNTTKNNINYTIKVLDITDSGEMRGTIQSIYGIRAYDTMTATTDKLYVVSPHMQKMTFQIGDTVIPYIMGTDGNDKPMSLYPDKTPKEFNVIGKGIIADGEIMQELTLQEIPKNE